MTAIRALLKDRSAAAAIVLILAEALILLGVSGPAQAASGPALVAVELCTEHGTESPDEDHHCCDLSACAIHCAAAFGAASIPAKQASEGIVYGFARTGRIAIAAVSRDIRSPTRSDRGIGARSPPATGVLSPAL